MNRAIIKQKAFRFSNTTIDNLKELVQLGIVRNETEAIDLAIMHFLTEKKTEARFKGTQTPRLGETPIHANNAMFDIAHILDATAQY